MAPGRDVHRTIDAVWRIESAKLIAALARMVRDVGQAEDLAQEALVAALERWPVDGIPDNPGAWLMATAKRRAIDRMQQSSSAEGYAPVARFDGNPLSAEANPGIQPWGGF